MSTKNADDAKFEAHDDEYGEDGLVEVVNEGGQKVTFTIGKRIVKLMPGKKTRVPRAYALKRAGDNPKGDSLPSVISLKTGGMVQPVDRTLRQEVDKRLVAKAG